MIQGIRVYLRGVTVPSGACGSRILQVLPTVEPQGSQG